MFYKGQKYDVKRATPSQEAAFAKLVQHQADMFLLLEAGKTLESVRFLVQQLVPDFPEAEVTEQNKQQILAAIKLHHHDKERADIHDTRDARRWAAENEKEKE